MAYTSLHRSVGSPPGPVTAEMLAQAVAIGLGEAEDLDWKQDADDVKDNRENAKDFASLANSRGGIIVTGVKEDGADHADELLGVEDERAKSLVTKFRSVATSLVRPFIPAFKVYSVPLPASPGRSAVVVEVPRSPEAPMLSGYGLRASRAMGWLAAAMLATIVLLMGFGLPNNDPKQEATGTVPDGGGKVTFEIGKDDPHNPTGNRFTGERFEKALNVMLNSVVFRSADQGLTTAGTYIEMTSRLTEPVLLGLAVLAVRNRVKR